MERDPVGFVWRAASAAHVAAFVLLGLSFLLGWIAIDLIRIAVDDAMSGSGFERSPFVSFLRLQIDLPERVAEQPLVVFPGFGLERFDFVVATILAVAAIAVLAALLVSALRALQTRISTQAVGRLRQRIVGGVLSARPSAREDARHAAELAGEVLAREADGLGSLVVAPVMAGGGIALAFLYALSVDWRLAMGVAAALAAIALLWPRRLEAESEAEAAVSHEGQGFRRSLDDLIRRLPALRAHGTAAFERQRLDRDLFSKQRTTLSVRRRVDGATGLAALAASLAPTLAFGIGAWLALSGQATAGEVVAVAAAALLAAATVISLSRWRQTLAGARPLFEEVARTLGSLQARGRTERGAPLPGSGALVADRVSAYDPASGARLSEVDLSVTFPSHAAAVGDAASGARVLAGLVGGQLDPSSGTLTFGGADLSAADPSERAHRIAFAGGETILVNGSLRDNLLYGSRDPDSAEMEHRLFEAATVVGLDGLIHARGLLGAVDPAREPKLAAAIVEARRAVRAALAAESVEGLVEPFEPQRYNRQATIGENILFGMPLGDTFREQNLPSHPFVRAILEAEGLTKQLTAMGLSIASSMVEIFADIPDGHPLFDRFSFFSAAERGYFEDLVVRQGERRRGAESARDRERLMGLALRYSESRHRLGLVDPDVEARLVSARTAFANLLPTSLRPALEFYNPETLCAAASLQDNLLFGRVAQDRAGAEADVRRIVRRVLTERGLDADVIRIGLDTRVDPRGTDLGRTEIAAIDVARCLVRRPDVLVIEHALDGLPPVAADAFIARLRRALVGRGLLVVVASLSDKMETPPFDIVLRFERGALFGDDRRREAAVEPAPAEAVA